jgi:FkbM family methyltransferase
MAHEFLRPGDRVLELGARYGSVSITAARRVGPRGRVVAVEPDARVLPALERNREANGADFLIRWGTLSARPMRVETAHEAGGARNYSTFTTPRGEKSGGPPVLQTAELEAAAGGPFTALIADCEGCLCEVPALPLLLGRLRVVLLEADAPQRCNYGRIRRALLAAGLRQAFGGQGHYQAWVRDE